MSLTVIDRRRVLSGVAGLSLTGCLNPSSSLGKAHREQVYVSAYTTRKRQHFFGFLSARGQLLGSIPVRERGHGACPQNRGEHVVLISRRPGRSFTVASKITLSRLRTVEAAPRRHFYGHGCFAPDGRTLYLTENKYETGEGVIGVYDAGAHYKRVGELASHGIGPHELELLADGETLVVANGGIQTHPSAPRQKMNLHTMRPSVAFLNRFTGVLKQRWYIEDPALQTLSIRHLAVHSNGRVVVVCQWEGDLERTPPLIGLCDLQNALHFIQAPERIHREMRNYCGSVRFDHSGEQFAVSAPRGHLIGLWSREGDFKRSYALPDGCGVAAQPRSGFLLTSGTGVIQLTETDPGQSYKTEHKLHWDNHVYAI